VKIHLGGNRTACSMHACTTPTKPTRTRSRIARLGLGPRLREAPRPDRFSHEQTPTAPPRCTVDGHAIVRCRHRRRPAHRQLALREPNAHVRLLPPGNPSTGSGFWSKAS
jgi:hypothetical protein